MPIKRERAYLSISPSPSSSSCNLGHDENGKKTYLAACIDLSLKRPSCDEFGRRIGLERGRLIRDCFWRIRTKKDWESAGRQLCCVVLCFNNRNILPEQTAWVSSRLGSADRRWINYIYFVDFLLRCRNGLQNRWKSKRFVYSLA